jgi:hypothetical protein
MKTIKYFFFVAMATLLMAADCSNKDSEFYNDVYISAPNLVTVEHSLIPESQTIFVNASIPRVLTVANISRPLDIFETTGGATKLVFSYELEKGNSDGTWDYVEFALSNVLNSKGESEVGPFVTARAVYNSDSKVYEYQAGIQNLSPGNYRLSFGYNSISTNLIEFRSESFDNNLFLNLESPTTILDGNGYYNFTVN